MKIARESVRGQPDRKRAIWTGIGHKKIPHGDAGFFYISEGLGKLLDQFVSQNRFRHGADLLVYDFTVLEEQ